MSSTNPSTVTLATSEIQNAASLPSEMMGLDDVLELLHPPGWHSAAACRDFPEVTWFPGVAETSEPATAICQVCVVRSDCLGWALEQGPALIGIWGGLSPHQRRWLRPYDETQDGPSVLRSVSAAAALSS